MSENTLLGIAAIGAVAVGGLIAWRMTDPNRQRVPYAPAQPSDHHPDVAVWAKVGGVWQRCQINAVNYASQQVTFVEP
ncbi:hypothetical protein CSW16_01560, partial [Thermus scotoductus]